MFSSFKLIFVSRLANEAAHSCARKDTIEIEGGVYGLITMTSILR
jgi:hypothetical protein